MTKLLVTALLIFSFSMNSIGQHTEDIQEAVNHFLGTLLPAELNYFDLDFADTMRYNWSIMPNGLEKRDGLRYGNLSQESRQAFHQILTMVFSANGYGKINDIMEMDDKLNEMYKELHEREYITDEMMKRTEELDWDYDNYFIWLWGKPDKYEPWGLKFEGHHLSINITIVGQEFFMTPMFMGAEPANMNYTKHAGLRILSKEEDYGFLFLHSLTEEQKAKAILDMPLPSDILTQQKAKPLPANMGIKSSDLTEKQKAFLQLLIKQYVHNLEFGRAHEYYEHMVSAHIDNIHFAWIGSTEKNKGHYYIIQSPDFIIEYDNVGLNNDGNHIHTVWRERGNDFGRDYLKEHYKTHPH